MTTNLKPRQNSVNQIFNPNAFVFFLLTGDKNITMLYTLFTGYEDDIFYSYFLFATSSIQNWRKNGPIWQIIQKKIELRGVHGVCFFQVCTILPSAKSLFH